MSPLLGGEAARRTYGFTLFPPATAGNRAIDRSRVAWARRFAA
jgi:hypothetical protein